VAQPSTGPILRRATLRVDAVAVVFGGGKMLTHARFGSPGRCVLLVASLLRASTMMSASASAA
jgi:hypothetical protein